MNNNITIIRGDDVSIKITFTNADDSVFNLTGYKVYFTAKKNATDADSAAVIQKSWTSHSNAAAGITYLTLSNTDTAIDTGNYACDLQIKSVSGAIQSAINLTLTVARDITITTA